MKAVLDEMLAALEDQKRTSHLVKASINSAEGIWVEILCLSSVHLTCTIEFQLSEDKQCQAAFCCIMCNTLDYLFLHSFHRRVDCIMLKHPTLLEISKSICMYPAKPTGRVHIFIGIWLAQPVSR
jgi:hypothetical protein